METKECTEIKTLIAERTPPLILWIIMIFGTFFLLFSTLTIVRLIQKDMAQLKKDNVSLMMNVAKLTYLVEKLTKE